MDTEKQVKLHDVNGLGEEFILLDGIDQDGNLWIYRRQSSETICVFCGMPVKEGWFCFENGLISCTKHVSFKGQIDSENQSTKETN